MNYVARALAYEYKLKVIFLIQLLYITWLHSRIESVVLKYGREYYHVVTVSMFNRFIIEF